jgi:NAD(P)-dependent dehydrogenase (short-subunit alcohol dehydrogenase family)
MASQINYDFSIAGKVAVVTGGASGIGAAIVDAYSAKGASVVVLDLALDAAQRKVSDGSAAAAYRCDVTNEQSVIDVINAVHTEFGRIDVLVNSAGIAVTDPAEQLTVKAWDQTMAINLRGAFLVSQQVGRVMLAQGSGDRDQFGLSSGDDRITGPSCLLRLEVRPGRNDKGACAGMGRTWRHCQHHQSDSGDDSAG